MQQKGMETLGFYLDKAASIKIDKDTEKNVGLCYHNH